MPPFITVHFLPVGFKLFACGEKPRAQLRGLDFLTTWDKVSDEMYVNCLDCLVHRPPDWQRKRMRSFDAGKKKRL